MKLSYDADNQEIFANDDFTAEVMDYFTSAAKDKCKEFHAELARRVNGWDRMVAALKGMLSPPENGGDVLEKIKFARAALKEAGE